MPLVYTKEEIKEYLAGRGFDVTNEDIIHQFIHDLKKLVKYEDRQRRRVRLGHEAHDTNLDTTGLSGDTAIGVTQTQRNHSSDFDNHVTAPRTSLNASNRGHHEKDQSRRSKQDHISSPRKSVRPQSHEDRHVGSRDRDWKHVHSGDTVDHRRGQKDNKHIQNRELSPKYNANYRPFTNDTDSTREKHPLKEQNGSSFHSKRSKPTKKAGPNGMVMSRKTLRQENGEQVIEETEFTVGHDGNATQRPRPYSAHGAGNFDERRLASELAASFRPKTAQTENSRDHVPSLLPNSRLQGSDMLRILGKILEESDKEDDYESVATTKTLRGPPNRVKRDPVALYHYYKRYWDKLKIPGEDRHMQTRWNVRAQTVGNYPCFEGHPVNYLTRI